MVAGADASSAIASAGATKSMTGVAKDVVDVLLECVQAQSSHRGALAWDEADGR